MADNLAIVYRSLEELIPYARNARTHTDAHIAQIAGSIREFGWTNPVLVDGDKGIIAGHGRVLAARKLGIHLVPCIELAGLSDVQRRAYILADNKLALNAGWDESLLRLELADLRDMAFDLSLIGFGVDEQASLLAERTEGLTDPDDAPEAPEHPVSEPGDLWLLGKHRLLCGDSTVATDVERVLGGVEPHLMVTDPPYGVSYDPKWRDQLDDLSLARCLVTNDDRVDWSDAYSLFPGHVCYIWHADNRAHEVAQHLIGSGYEIRAQIIWVKPHFVISRGHYHRQHEPCWYAVRKGATGHWVGDRKQSTCWQIANALFQGKSEQDQADKHKTGHGTQKPVECMRRPIENNSSPGQAVYEPFSGSGTTIIAAEMTGRGCHAIEISPAYIDVAVKRWQDFTGKQAVLDDDGRTFGEIEATRKPTGKAA